MHIGLLGFWAVHIFQSHVAGRCLHSWVKQKELNSITESDLRNLKGRHFIFQDMLLYMNVKDGEKRRKNSTAK